MRTDTRLCEANGWACSTYDCGDGLCNIVDPDLLTLSGITHNGNGGDAGGAMALKVSHSVMQCLYQTPLGVTGLAMANGLSFDAIFLHETQQAKKVRLVHTRLGGQWRRFRISG